MQVSFENSLVIENLRKESIEKGELPSAINIPRVKVKIFHNNENVRSDMRLKGDRMVHFQEKKNSSYKFELDKNNYLFGLKKFSLQKPRVRNYIHEWLFHEISRKNGLINLTYKFINLSINGDDQGLYVLEEGFGKELIERNKRRNGPIFSLDEDVYGYDDKPVFEIYNKNFWSKAQNNTLARIASQKLRDFFKDKANVEEVFDLEKWATYFAVVDLTANYHGAFLKSVKLYYNPLNGLFEPIPFDGHRSKPNYHKKNLNYDNRILIDIVQNPIGDEKINFQWLKKFFFKNNELNKLFYKTYIGKLNKISNKKYINNFLEKNNSKIEQINSHIYADYFFYDNITKYGVGIYYFLESDLRHHAGNIRSKLKLKDQIQLVKVSSGEYIFKNFYKNYGIIETDRFECTNNNKNINIQLSKKINNFEDTRIKINTENYGDLKCNYLFLRDTLNQDIRKLKVDFINSNYSYKNFKNLYSKNLKEYFTISGNILKTKERFVEINKNIYIPSGFHVIIEEGQKVLITNQAFLISNSPWTIGGMNKTTTITGLKNNYGGGIFIGETKKTSKINNTNIAFLNGFNQFLKNEYLILGSLNFYETNVKLDKVSFKNIFSEDAINIFRSNFEINNTQYSNISSDAVDIDFGKGELKNVNFINVNNDAIDFSGSDAKVKNAKFNNINDKIISAGENSKITINKIEGKNSFIGIASKDGSKVISNDINFNNVKIPFAVYQKKKEYNYPSLFTENYSVNNFYIKSIKDKTAEINISEETIIVEKQKILPIIYEKKLFLLN